MTIEIIQGLSETGVDSLSHLTESQQLLLDCVDSTFPILPTGLGHNVMTQTALLFVAGVGQWVAVVRHSGEKPGDRRLRIFSTVGNRAVDAWDRAMRLRAQRVAPDPTLAPTEGAPSDRCRVALERILADVRFVEIPGFTERDVAATLRLIPEAISRRYIWAPHAMLKLSDHPIVLGDLPQPPGLSTHNDIEIMKRDLDFYRRAQPTGATAPREIVRYLIGHQPASDWKGYDAASLPAFLRFIDEERDWSDDEIHDGLRRASQNSLVWSKIRGNDHLGRLRAQNPELLFELLVGGRVPMGLRHPLLHLSLRDSRFGDQLHDEMTGAQPWPLAALMREILIESDWPRVPANYPSLSDDKVHEWLKAAGAPASRLVQFEPLSTRSLCWFIQNSDLEGLLRKKDSLAQSQWPKTWTELWGSPEFPADDQARYWFLWGRDDRWPAPPDELFPPYNRGKHRRKISQGTDRLLRIAEAALSWPLDERIELLSTLARRDLISPDPITLILLGLSESRNTQPEPGKAVRATRVGPDPQNCEPTNEAKIPWLPWAVVAVAVLFITVAVICVRISMGG